MRQATIACHPTDLSLSLTCASRGCGRETLQQKHFVLLVATYSFAALGLSLLSYSTIAVYVSADLHLSDTASGLIASAFGLTYALMQVPSGYLADRFGAARTLLVALTVSALAPLIFVAGHDLTAALVSRAISGAACGALLPAAVGMLSSWFQERELRGVMAVFGSGFGLGQVVTYLGLPLLIFNGDWRPPLLFVVAVGSVCAVMALLPARWAAGRTARVERTKMDVRGLLTFQLLALILPNLAFLAISVGALTWAPEFLTLKLHLSIVDAGRVIALYGFMSAAASFASAAVARRLGDRRTILLSLILNIIFVALFGVASTPAEVVLLAAGLGWASMLYFAPLFALVPYATKQGPAAAGVAFGLFNSVSNLGSFVAPVFMGYLLDRTGSYGITFAAVGLLGAVGIVGGLMISTRRANAA